MTMHHFESMPSLHFSSNNDSFPSSPPASPLSFTSTTPSLAGKRRGHTHRRSLAISSHLTFPTPSTLDQNPAMITPPLSSPALSFPHTASLESLRSGTMLDYDSDLPRTPTIDGDSLRAIPSLEILPPTSEREEELLPDTETDVQMDERETSPSIGHASKLRKVAFNDAVIYYPPRPASSRQCSFSSQISQPSSRETTPAASSPPLSHRRSLSSLLLPSPSFLPSNTSPHRHTRDRKSWTGLITSPFTAARRRRSPNRYRPPTPPLGYDDDRIEVWPQPPVPIIDLDAALGPFQTPGSPLSPTHSAKFWSVTSHVGTSHRRSESAPEIRGLGLDTPLTNDTSEFRGLKRKMSVIDEEDRAFRMDVDNDLHEIMIQEGAEMGEMGDLVVDKSLRGNNMENKLSKRQSWRKSLREWWRKV